MTDAPPPSEAHQPLRPLQFEILLLLEQEPLHGYGVLTELRDRGTRRFALGPATLYRNLSELERAGWIEESERRPAPAEDDERRRYYRLTEAGREAARTEAQRLQSQVEAARRVRLLPSRRSRA